MEFRKQSPYPLVKYSYYEVYTSDEPDHVPFYRFINYLNDHPNCGLFLFANRCSKDDIDTWLDNSSHATIHWCKDVAEPPSAPTNEFEEYLLSVHPPQPKISIILEISSPISVADLRSIYYPGSRYPAGSLLITRSRSLSPEIINNYERSFHRDAQNEDGVTLVRSIYSHWALLGYYESRYEYMGPDFRAGYLNIPAHSDIDESFIDWGTIQGAYNLED